MTTAIAAARFLARHIPAIAQDEAAAELFADIKAAVESIERVVNRPIPEQFCGTCTTPIEGTPCDMRLYAPREAVEVFCTRCKTTHNIEQLFQATLESSDDYSFTIAQLHLTILPAVRCKIHDPERTMQRWFTRGRLVPTGYDAKGEPTFLLADVRKLQEARPQTAPTGAAAEKYKRKAG